MARLYSVPQARELIPVGHSKFYELIGSGELRSVKIGSRRFVSASAVDEYIAKLEAESASAAVIDDDRKVS